MPFIWSLEPKQPQFRDLFLNERSEPVGSNKFEVDEQILAKKYIEKDFTVLELGARYGTVSYAINSNLNVKTNHVTVEPDPTVWDALEHNLRVNNCQTHVVHGFISREKLGLVLAGYSGYASTFTKDSDAVFYPECFTLEDIEAKYNLKFDALVADCEGGLEIFLDENPKLYTDLKFIMFEADYPDKCNYDKIRTRLAENGFKEVEVRGIQNIWKRI